MQGVGLGSVCQCFTMNFSEAHFLDFNLFTKRLIVYLHSQV